MTFNESDEEVDDRANFFILIWPRIDFRENNCAQAHTHCIERDPNDDYYYS